MMYVPRHMNVEAEKVLLSGQDLVAVVVDDRAHLVDGAVFRLFFDLAPGAAALMPREVVVGRPRKTAAPAPSKPTAPKGAGRLSPIRDAVLRAVEEQARTTPELVDRVLDWEKGTSRDYVGQVIAAAKNAGLIERRPDPETRLEKWFMRAA